MNVNTPVPATLKIGELAELTGLAAHRLRHYEDHGLLPSTRDANGYRSFSADAVQVVARVTTLLAAGLNVEEIARVLPRLQDDDPGQARLDVDTEQLLRARSALLEAQIGCLASARRVLAHILDNAALDGAAALNECWSGRMQAFNTTVRRRSAPA